MRINQTYKLLWLLAMQLVVFSCDVVPYKDAHDQIAPIDTGSQDTLVGQNILIEDFTGHYCGNCPLAAIEAKRLEEKYGSRIVVMGIHCTYFAKPKDPNGIFGNDYRTPAGDALESKFNVGSAGLPKGLINRSRFGKTSVDILNYDAWESKVSDILKEAPAGIKMELLPDYNSSNQTLRVGANIRFQKGYDATSLKMAMYLTEDSIVSGQKFYGQTPEDMPAYRHMHVLRSDLLPQNGSDILNTATKISPNQSFSSSWTMQVDVKIKVKNTHVVMVLYRSDNDEIVQVIEKKTIAN